MSLIREMNYKIQIAKNKQICFDKDIRFIFIIEGQIKITISNNIYILNKHDIILINSGAEYSINVPESAIICVVTYSTQFVCDLIGKSECNFECNSVHDKIRSYQKLRAIFQQLVYHSVSGQHKTPCIEQSILYRLLDELIEKHLINISTSDDDIRINKILSYVHVNFQNSVSLSNIAEEMFVSTSTLSRIFKKHTGVSFAEYVNDIRVKYAAQELKNSNKNITQIAVDSGFSNLSVFNRIFKDVYFLTPSDYRKEQKNIEKQKSYDLKELKAHILKEFETNTLQTTVNKVIQKCSVKNNKIYDKNWNKIMNIGSISTLLMSNIQKHVLYLSENLDFKYARIWNIFSNPMMIADGQTVGNYQFDNLDMVLDFLVQNSIIPFLDMGIRPNASVKSIGQPTFFKDECVIFKSKEVWESTILEFVNHIVKRYGINEVKTWIFELTYDMVHIPNSNCYIDKNYKYVHAYSYLYKTLKSVSDKIKVGGLGAIEGLDNEFILSCLRDCKRLGCKPDFVSFVLFPYEPVIENGKIIRHKISVLDNELNQIQSMENILRKAELDCDIYISEWNNSISNRDYLNDSCFRGAYVAEKINKIWDRVKTINIWMASDWVSNYFDTGGKLANGGSGLITKNMIHKPVYYAIGFLNSMGNQLISRGNGHIITKKGDNDYYILCYNFKWFDCSYFVKGDDIENPEYLKNIFTDNESIDFDITLDDIEFKKCIIKKRIVSPKEGNILKEWSKFQYDLTLDTPDIEYIKQACFPRMSMEKKDILNNMLNINIKLDPHEIVLLHIYSI